MRKGKALLGFVLSLVLFFGGVVPNIGTAYGDMSTVMAMGQTIALKVMEDGANVTIKRVDETDATLYRTMTKEDLPRNAVIRFTLSDDDSESYSVKNVDVDGTAYTLATLPDELEVRDGSVVKIVYEATTSGSGYDSFDVTFYDYDYSSPTGGGINDERNYPAGSTESQRLQMAVTDNFHDGMKSDYSPVPYGSTLGMTNYEVPMLLHRPAIGSEPEATAVGKANWNNGVDAGSGNVGIDGVFWPIVAGLVTGLDEDGNPIWGTNNNGEQIVDPGFFTNEEKLGKHIYTKDNLAGGASLDFERTGYHYVLKRANVNGTPTYVKVDNGGVEISNPRFFPLDGLADASQKFVDPWHSITETIEDYDAHNWYFGIRQEFTFTVGEYDGPLEYIFEGDDDLWVFLDDQLVLDLGGVHSAYPSGYAADTIETAWPNKVDIKSIIQNQDPDTWRDKEYKVTILYMERGGYDSNCYMEFTLPIKAASALNAVIDIPAETEFTGQEDAVADGNFNPATDEVTVYLIDKATIDDEHPTIIATKTTSAANGWSVDFSEVDLDAGIEYAVIGEILPDFKKPVITGNISDGFHLSYEYSPELMNLTIQKVWEPSVVAAGRDTSSVQVKVLADGVQYGEILTISEADGWSKTLNGLQVRKNKTAIAYTVEEVNVPTGIVPSVSGAADTGYVITNNMEHPVTYTFVKKEASMPNLPAGITAMIPSSTTALGGTTVVAVAPSNTTYDVAEGTWVFEGYDAASKIVSGDTTFVGTWRYDPKPIYDVTYSFVSGTSGRDLPAEVVALKPAATTAMEGTTVNAVSPTRSTVDVGDGIWTFTSYDSSSAVVTGNVNFEGTWVYTEKPIYNVTHTFVSGTAGVDLPAEVTALTPAAGTAREGDVVAPTTPAQTRYEVGVVGYWTLIGYDKTNVTVTSDVNFVGTWKYVTNPVHNVTHTFVSGTEGRDLPAEVMALRPYDFVATEGTTAVPTAPLQTSVEVTDGFWNFVSYDKASAVVDTDLNFEGTWTFAPKAEYPITHSFVSGTAGKTLPAEVTALVPAQTTAYEGSTVYATNPAVNSVEVADGFWNFVSYDRTSATVSGAVNFEGTWTFLEKPTYNITHSFVSGTAGKTLPAEVTALLPTTTTAIEGSTANAVNPAQTTVEVADGVWSFGAYDRTSATVNADVNFEGTWTFAAKRNVTHSFVSGTDGKTLPAEVTDLLPAATTALEGSVVNAVNPAQTTVAVADGVWTFVAYDQTTATVNDDVNFEGTWTFAATPIYNVTYEFKSSTSGVELPLGVLDYLPAATTALEGTTVNAEAPTIVNIETPDGYWEFEGYDNESAVANANVKFIGTWKYTAKPTYKVSYSFVSGTEGKSLPAEVLAVRPRTVENLRDRTVVVPAQPGKTSVEVTGGIWKFVRWDKTQLTINGRDAAFVGTWVYTANTTTNNNNSSSNNNNNNNNSSNNQPANTTNPVSPKTGENAWGGVYGAATLAMIAGVLVLRKKKEQ